MGAKAWFVAYFEDDPKAALAKGPKLDMAASRALAERLFPDAILAQMENGRLGELCPEANEILVGSYGALRIVAHKELVKERPSTIDDRWVDPAFGRFAYVHLIHSVVDWFAFGLWRDGRLIRSLSVAPDGDVSEDIGDPLGFEAPFWDGKHPVTAEVDDQPYPLPFHPLEMAEESMLQRFGFQFERIKKDWICDPYEIPIAAYSMRRSWRWKFW